MEMVPITLSEFLSGALMLVLIAGLAIYVFVWPEKKCPKCQTPLVRFMPPGSNYFQVGCPKCNTYTRED